MSETIEVTRDESVLLIRLNRPKYLNALNSTLARELIDAVAVAVAGKDPVVGAIVLSGSETAFAAGADIGEMAGNL